MKRMIGIALIGGLLVVGSGRSISGESTRYQALFCPQCWDYLWGPASVDLKGHCAVCGKYPVEIDATPMTWWWCAREKKWRRAACDRNWKDRCCAAEESLAARVSPNLNVFEDWYCPAHRSFFIYQIPIIGQRVCKTCARPAVKVDALERAWYWCKFDEAWGSLPCPLNSIRKCCVKREGVLLVNQDPGPLAR